MYRGKDEVETVDRVISPPALSEQDSLKLKTLELELKIDKIIDQLKSIDTGTSKMSRHIDFIEEVYNKVSAPMYWICRRITNIRGFGHDNLNCSETDDVSTRLKRTDTVEISKFDIDSQD